MTAGVTWLSLIVSFALGLAPPLLIRLVLSKQFAAWVTLAIVAGLFAFNTVLFVFIRLAIGIAPGLFGTFLIAVASLFILGWRSGSDETSSTVILLGLIIAVVLCGANVYLGLYAGMTVSASIPAAVIGMGVLRLIGRNSILGSNIIQTIASSGESLAAGIIFTVPALVLVGAWNEFAFWPTTIIAISGGLLGVVFMIPLRRALIVEDRELTYPEGVACASVLKAGSEAHSAGLGAIARGLGIGSLFKLGGTGLGLLRGSVEYATKAGERAFFLGSDISPALLAVGYIVRLEIAALVFIGGAIGWLVGIPALGTPAEMAGASAQDVAWEVWSKEVRYLGVGAMVVGGIWSIITVRRGIGAGIRGLRGAYVAASRGRVARTDRDMGLVSLLVIFVLCVALTFLLYEHLIGAFGMSILMTGVMVIASFFIVAIASYICGLVGSSNSPVSGMTISALLGTASLLLVFGYKGQSAILATLGVAAVVCCAACSAGDISQDLKTGYLVGATPRAQQWGEVLGAVVPAFVIAPVLTLLHRSYGIGDGLKAPQATLFASITEGIFGDGTLPYDMVWYGAALGVGVVAFDLVLRRAGAHFRLHLMPLAVGIYLPLTLSVPILFGGIIRKLADRTTGRGDEEQGRDPGILFGSGLIAGEAIMGVLLAAVIYVGVSLKVELYSASVSDLVSVAAFAALACYLYRVARTQA